MPYRKKKTEPRGRVIILDSARRIPPEDLAWVTGMCLQDLVHDIVNDRSGKYAKILVKKPAPGAAAPAGE